MCANCVPPGIGLGKTDLNNSFRNGTTFLGGWIYQHNTFKWSSLVLHGHNWLKVK